MIIGNSMVAGSMMADNLRLSLNRHAQTLERISSGKRINSAKDDPAGLSMATKLSATIRTSDVFEKNIQNAISFLQVQDGVLAQMGSALERMAELKALSDDVTKSSEDVELYQTEYVALQEHLEHLCMEEFNGIRLFASSSTPDHFFVQNLERDENHQISRPFTEDLFVGFTRYVGGNVYSVVLSDAITWSDARVDAETKGGHLVSITSEEEMEKVSKIAPDSDSRNLWIGATDGNEEGVWEWVTSESWNYTNWASGEPNNYNKLEHYAHKKANDVKWNDYPNDGPFNTDVANIVNGYILERESLSIRELDAINLTSSLQNIAQARATNGAEQNRLQIASALNATNKQNRKAALSAIQDTDIARASADLAKSRIFIEAGTALLAMQNVSSQSVLRLLD
jgi:flagellin